MTPITPIRYKPARHATPDTVSQVVANTGCSRLIALAHLEATRGDVEAACASWHGDHGGWAQKAAYDRWTMSLEASE